jgi:phytoene dehydrogenase-like protein
MMEDPVDYLVLGSGLSALAFSALMAQKGHTVKVLEAHEHFGGYGHTFVEGDYKFNAQLHYVIGCGEGGSVDLFLKKLGLDKEVTFNQLNTEGYDRVYCDDKVLNIPNGYDKLQRNMTELFPESAAQTLKFVNLLRDFEAAANVFPKSYGQIWQVAKALPSYWKLFKLRNATLQDVFDECGLPQTLQTLVSGQLIDYMLPPKQLSFLVWAALFNGYNNGAYYPTKHFDHVINSLTDFIKSHGGTLHSNQQVVDFIVDGKTVQGVSTQCVDPKTGIYQGAKHTHYGKTVVCNFDPKLASEMIGKDQFSKQLQTSLDYDYSYSSFVLYGVVQDLDLAEYGFGDWNIWHCQPDHNESFRRMYELNDYSQPYFAMNCRSLHTDDSSNCNKENCQIFQICTVANYDYWKMLKMRSKKDYNLRKKEVLHQLLDAVEENYVPNLREHLVFKMTGSPTTNERFAWAPKGGSYGVNLTPRNFRFSRKLTSESSLKNLYFCSAAAGVGGFGGTILTGTRLYEKLTGDSVG